MLSLPLFTSFSYGKARQRNNDLLNQNEAYQKEAKEVEHNILALRDEEEKTKENLELLKLVVSSVSAGESLKTETVNWIASRGFIILGDDGAVDPEFRVLGGLVLKRCDKKIELLNSALKNPNSCQKNHQAEGRDPIAKSVGVTNRAASTLDEICIAERLSKQLHVLFPRKV